MNKFKSLNDPLNLRDLIDQITAHVRTEGSADAQPRTLNKFIESLLANVTAPVSTTKKKVEEYWGDALQKVFSGNIHYSKLKPLTDEITSGKLDGLLRNNLQRIVDEISALPKAEKLYSRLWEDASKRFFPESEISELRLCLDQKDKKIVADKAAFLLILLKHGFSTLYNLPCFFSERIYEEALTYDYDTPLRFSLMREAAENGNRSAALEYGNYLAKNEKYEEAFRFLLIATPLPSAVWNLAFLLENTEKKWVGNEQLRQFRNELKIEEKAGKDENCVPFLGELEDLVYTGDNPAFADAYLTAYRTYFFLAHRDFFKAYNSMAKLLEQGKIGFSGPDGDAKAAELRRRYSSIAIVGGNVMALSNEGNRLRREREEKKLYDSSSDDERYVKELLTVAAERDFMHARFFLGRYKEYALAHGADDISLKEIVNEYRKAEELDHDGTGIRGRLYIRIAALEKNRDLKIKYYEKALEKVENAKGKELDDMARAAYSLSFCLLDKYYSERDVKLLSRALDILNEMMNRMPDDCHEDANMLKGSIESELFFKRQKTAAVGERIGLKQGMFETDASYEKRAETAFAVKMGIKQGLFESDTEFSKRIRDEMETRL